MINKINLLNNYKYNYDDNCSSLLGWENIGQGEVAANGIFYATSYGTGSSYHGPILKKNISPLDRDFSITFIITFTPAINYISKLCLCLCNDTNDIISGFDLSDAWFDSTEGTNWNRTCIYNNSSIYSVKTSGILESIPIILKRINNIYYYYENGTLITTYTGNKLKIASVQISFLQYSTYAVNSNINVGNISLISGLSI